MGEAGESFNNPPESRAPFQIEPSRDPFLVRSYLRSRRLCDVLNSLIQAIFSGVWLGIMDREDLQRLDEAYYRKNGKYVDQDYNRKGLFEWEQAAIDRYFIGCRTLLLIAVGGGREALALHRQGFEVDAVECHPRLLESANDLMRQENIPVRVRQAPRDECPPSGKTYDGSVVGWGAYMLIFGRDRRIAFLRSMLAVTH